MKQFFKGYPRVYCADADKVKKGFQAGLFAARDFKKGEYLFAAQGEIITLKITNKKESADYPNAIGIKSNVWINPPNTNPLRYLNHSCEPNAGIKGSVTFMARRDIKKDEHITMDYSITECDKLWTLEKKCKCGAQKCRDVVRAIQFLPAQTYRSYMPYIGKGMQRAYISHHHS